MKPSILFAIALLISVVSGAPYSIFEPMTPVEHHIIKHQHKINCQNCYCGEDAIQRALHECSADRDLVLCPRTVLNRVCYRCSCYTRIPVTPSPFPKQGALDVKHDDDGHEDAHDDHKQDHDNRKHADDDHKQDHDNHKHADNDHKQDHDNHKRADDDRKQDHEDHKHAHDDRKHANDGRKHAHDDQKHPDDVTHEDMMMPTPDEDDHDLEKPENQDVTKSSSPSRTPETSTIPTLTPSPKPCATFERGGGGGNTIFDVDLSQTHGKFLVSWQMDSIPDMVEIVYEGKIIYTTMAPVSGRGSAYVHYSGKSTVITVWVASHTSGTGWFLKFGCPIKH